MCYNRDFVSLVYKTNMFGNMQRIASSDYVETTSYCHGPLSYQEDEREVFRTGLCRNHRPQEDLKLLRKVGGQLGLK